MAENITFVNSAGQVGQAVALYVDADKAVFRNCRFLGNQDTIFASGENARQYFTDCYIEGTTDFIFGPATSFFEHCRIHCKTNSFITAANTPKDKKYGFVFRNCTITADTSVSKLYLGRPWRSYARTAFIECALPACIAPEGWENWSNPENEKTTFYAEYHNTGSETKNRATWSHQLSEKEALQYSIENVLGSSDSGWYRNIRSKAFEWPAKAKT